ncbi:MAG TPA: carboxypeptidase-like regulatory domain-containing protein, partial [Flavisolibacter sp.]|nr:carboxypeptidase-like regulatory domain-containing protein [Flavisolibacter sp.]
MCASTHSMRKVLLSAIFLCMLYVVHAQQIIRGKIYQKENDQPLSGATVAVKGTAKSTVSDVNGSFAIEAADNDILQVSYIGYSTAEIKASDAAAIRLTISGRNMDEVVVTALGVRKEVKKLGYAVQEVKGEDLTKARDANPITGLTGKVAGLSVGPSAELLRKPTV